MRGWLIPLAIFSLGIIMFMVGLVAVVFPPTSQKTVANSLNFHLPVSQVVGLGLILGSFIIFSITGIIGLMLFGSRRSD